MKHISTRTARHTSVLLTLVALAVPAMAQSSHSAAYVTDNSNGNNSCISTTGFGGLNSTASCTHVPVTPVAITGGTGSAFSTSDNPSRTASATTTLAQTGSANSMNGLAEAFSTQNSFISVTGGSGTTDNLVFHFLTPIAQGMGANGNTNRITFWQLILNAGSFSGNEQAFTDANGTNEAIMYTNATPTVGGVDFTVPFSAFSSPSTLGYMFEPFVQSGIAGNEPSGTTSSAALTATLGGVDAQTAQGRFIARAVFGTNGAGTLDLTGTTTTAPEPSSVVLMATGLSGLAAAVRRKRGGERLVT